MQKLLGQELYREILGLCKENELYEIRLRLGRFIEVKTARGNFFTRSQCDEKVLDTILLNAVRHCRYAYEKEMGDGYVDYDGGIRIGIAGSAKESEKNGLIYQKIYGMCIRIPHEIIGTGELIAGKEFSDTLVLSPPGCGKTTLIRDIGRILSERYDTLFIDERCELCGKGITMTLGKHADVIQGVKKDKVFENAIRVMSPEIIVCDELFSEKDFLSVAKIMSSGIRCLASFHGRDIKSLPPAWRDLFETFIVLGKEPKPGTVLKVERRIHD